ncbi:helix-turn-helix domain-containing protein [Parafilimonas terrae]|jgi:DNA-binding Xre family transcriptional regulator|nr:helix-turn-helix transcriptional regulator [Parafilimonas terrae]
MRVGDNIKEIRMIERNLKSSFVAKQLHISTRAYTNIENNLTDITLNRLEEIARILECSPLYILNYKQAKRDFYNHFHNNSGNQGINIMHQGSDIQDLASVQKLKDELLESERKRIDLLERLLKKNNIDF